MTVTPDNVVNDTLLLDHARNGDQLAYHALYQAHHSRICLVTGTKGAVEADTISGDLVLKGVDGPIAANSISGDISIKKAAGQVKANTVSGDIKLEGSAKTYDLATVSGDLRLVGALLSHLEGATVSGDIQIRASLAPMAKSGWIP